MAPVASQRVLIADSRSFAGMPLKYQPVTVRRRAMADMPAFCPAARSVRAAVRAFAPGSWYYANSGMDLFARGASLPFAFYDVADADSMLAALDQARTQSAV